MFLQYWDEYWENHFMLESPFLLKINEIHQDHQIALCVFLVRCGEHLFNLEFAF